MEILLKFGLHNGLAVLRRRLETFTSTWSRRARLSQQVLWQLCPALHAEASFMAVCCNVKCSCTGSFLRGGILCLSTSGGRDSSSVYSEHTVVMLFVKPGRNAGFSARGFVGFSPWERVGSLVAAASQSL